MKQPLPLLPNVSRETHDRLARYVALIERWNPAINLFSRSDIKDIWARHINDALQLLPLFPDAPSHAIDLGTGGGIPGVVLAIASNVHFHFIESDIRKCAFLREVARETNTSATIHNSRIETTKLPPAPLVTARALAPLPRLLSLAAPFLSDETIFLAPKGETALVELTAAQKEWHMQVECIQSATHPAALILKMSEVRRVGNPT